MTDIAAPVDSTSEGPKCSKPPIDTKAVALKWLLGLLSAIAVLVVSTIVNFYQAGTIRQLDNIKGIEKDIGDIKVGMAAIRGDVKSINIRLEDHMGIKTNAPPSTR